MFWSISKAFEEGFTGILVTIDSLIYWFCSKLYALFVDIASVRIFEDDIIKDFANRIYSLIGIIMLFVLAYSLLNAIVNPDKFIKGDKSGGKIVLNVISSLILIAVIPTIFNYGYVLQNIIVSNNVVGTLMLGQKSSDASSIKLTAEDVGNLDVNEYKNVELNPDGTYTFYVDMTNYNVKSYGTITSLAVLNAFFNSENNNVVSSSSEYIQQSTVSGIESITFITCGAGIIGGLVVGVSGFLAGGVGAAGTIPAGVSIATVACGVGTAVSAGTQLTYNITKDDLTWDQATTYIKQTGDFGILRAFVPQIVAEEIDYSPIISTICGLILLYIMFSFCLDLGIRSVKLVFFQLIAPIPIISRVLPGQKMFGKWLKQLFSAYFDVFIRLIIIYTITYLAANISAFAISSVGMIGKAIIIMGLVAFAKQAPKLISDIFGIGNESLKLGIRDKLAAGGLFTAGAALGAFGTGLVRRAVKKSGIQNKWKSMKDSSAYKSATKAEKAREIARTMGSGARTLGVGGLTRSVLSGVSAGVRGGKAGKSAKTFDDVKSAAHAGSQVVLDKVSGKEKYKILHPGSLLSKEGVAMGHVYDAGTTIRDWATGGASQFKEQIEIADKIIAKGDAVKTATDDLMKKQHNLGMVQQKMGTVGIDARGNEFAIDNKFKGANALAILNLFNKEFKDNLDLEQIRTAIAAEDQKTDFSYAVNLVPKAKFLTTDTIAYNRAVNEAVAKVDRKNFLSDISYQAAVDNAKAAVKVENFQIFNEKDYNSEIKKVTAEEERKHAIRKQNLHDMFTQLEDASRLKVQNAISKGDNISLAEIGIDENNLGKVDPVATAMEDFKREFESVGSEVSYEVPEFDQYGNRIVVEKTIKGLNKDEKGNVIETGDSIDKIVKGFKGVKNVNTVKANKYAAEKAAREANKTDKSKK